MSGGSDRAPTFGASELLGLMEHRLGGGAFGTVYSLRGHPSLAVKEIRLDALDDRLARNAEFELSALARLSHPGILRCHQVIVDDSFAYVVTDRYHDTLGSVIISHMRAREPVPRELLLSIVKQVTSALAYLHSARGTGTNEDPYQGIVHRDLKPANILVSEDGNRVVLADFGLCRSAMTSGTTRAGSPAYMAPETLLEGKSTPASDIWALGVITYELAALKRPNFLEGREPKDVFINGWKSNLSDVKNDFIREILEKIFVLDPEKRLTARELHEMLSPCDVSADELGAQYMVLQHKCSSLEAALNDASARIAILEGDTKTKSGKIVALEEGLEAKAAKISTLEEVLAAKSDQIDVLEDQCKEHLATTKALENKIALLTANSPQFELLLLPRLMRAAHTNSIETVRMLVEGGDGVGKRDEQGKTALMHAAQQGHVEPARLLVEKEKGLQDRNGWTALIHAVQGNHPGVVEILATHECGKRDNNNRTALMIAAERGYAEIVAALAPHEKGLADSNGNTALMLAANNAHIETVRRLVEHEKGMRDNQNHNALYYALKSGHMEVVDVLIEDDDPTDKNGVTALMRAADRGDVEAVRLLIPLQKEIKDKYGNMAFIHALNNSHVDAALLLREYEAPSWTPLMCAAFTGNTEIAGKHLSERNRKNSDGDTALMIAARVGHGTVVELLDPIDEHDVTALMRAAARGDAEMVELLIPIQKGAKDKDGNTAFTHALNNSHVDAALLLREYEAPSWTLPMHAALIGDIETVRSHLRRRSCCKNNIDGDIISIIAAKAGHKDIVELLDPTDEKRVTALMRAAERGDVDAVRALIPLQKKREVTECFCINAETIRDNGTALMRAAKSGRTEVVRLLVEHEGGMQDEYGETALTYALKNGHTGCIKLLVEKEAGMQDKDGWTTLMRAAENNNLEHVKLLLEKEGGMQNSEGYTALMIAIKNNNVDCARLLAKKEGHIKRTYERRNTGYSYAQTCTETALDIAKANRCKAIIAILSEGIQ